MRTIERIKEEYRKQYGDEFVEYIEYLENDLKDYAILKEYSYQFFKESETNVHTFIFDLAIKHAAKLTDAEIKKIEKLINTYDEGSVTSGVIHFGSIFVTIYGDS